MNVIKFAYIPFAAVSTVGRGLAGNPKTALVLIVFIIVGSYLCWKSFEDEHILE